MGSPLATVAAGLVLVLGPGVLVPAPGSHASPVPADQAVAPTASRRPELIGRSFEWGAGAPDREVAAIVELTGETVAERVARAPMLGVAGAERALRAEQSGSALALRLAGARVTGRLVHAFNGVTVRVRVGDLARLEQVAGVRTVQVARLVHRANGLANDATGVPAVWEAAGRTGAGVTIGIVDDGIDYTHADFGGSGLPADYVANDRSTIEPGTFPTVKVVGGYDFAGDGYDAGDPDADTQVPDPDPLACGIHGTHVAGTAAGYGVDDATGQAYPGPYDSASTAGVTFRVAPGAAPEASLRAYKVFGCDGSSDDALIVQAIDRAIADGVDVLNLSLGEALGTGSPTDLLVKAVTKANARGVLVVVAAGNAGAAPYLVGSPSTANAALSVAAMDAGPATYPGVDIGTVPAITGVETNETSVGAGVTGPVAVVVPGCDDGDYTGVAGSIVVTSLVDGCAAPAFDHLEGVLAVVVVVEEYFRAGFMDVDVPVVLVRAADAAPILAADGATVTLAPGAPVPNPQSGGYADFSAGGPRRGDAALKPDVTAPGVSLRSAHAGTGSAAAELSGTSMAAPHTAGIAALVVQAHPAWRPAQVKAAIMSTADPAGIAGADPRRGGTGLVSAPSAVDTVAYLSTADGRHSLGFGFTELTGTFNRVRRFRITNTSNVPITYDLGVELAGPVYGAVITVSPSTVVVAPRTTRTAIVRLRIDASVLAGLPNAAESDFGVLRAISGLVVATPEAPAPGVHTLHLAFSMVPKALSSVTAPPRVAAGVGSVTLRNGGQHAGTADVFTWVARDVIGDVRAREVPDIIDLGVKSYPWDPVTQTGTGPDRQVVFAVSTRTAVSTHSTQEFAVLVDVDNDDVEDFLLIAGDAGLESSGVPDGRFVTFTVDLVSDLVVDAFTSEAPYNGSVVYLRTMASSLGTTVADGPWRFWMTASSPLLDRPVADDLPAADWLVYHPFRPYLSVAAGGGAVPIALAPGATASVPFSVDEAESAQSDRGLLVVTPDDAGGIRSASAVLVVGI